MMRTPSAACWRERPLLFPEKEVYHAPAAARPRGAVVHDAAGREDAAAPTRFLGRLGPRGSRREGVDVDVDEAQRGLGRVVGLDRGEEVDADGGGGEGREEACVECRGPRLVREERDGVVFLREERREGRDEGADRLRAVDDVGEEDDVDRGERGGRGCVAPVEDRGDAGAGGGGEDGGVALEGAAKRPADDAGAVRRGRRVAQRRGGERRERGRAGSEFDRGPFCVRPAPAIGRAACGAPGVVAEPPRERDGRGPSEAAWAGKG